MDHRDIEPGVERWDAGLEILRITDGLGFDTQAAGWIFLPEGEQWRYYLITPMVDEKGPRWIYERLLKVFAKMTLPPGISPLDIFVGSPKDPLFRGLVKAGLGEQIETAQQQLPPGALVRLAVADVRTENLHVARALFYRLSSAPLKARPRLFERRVQQVLAA